MQRLDFGLLCLFSFPFIAGTAIGTSSHVRPAIRTAVFQAHNTMPASVTG